MLSGLIKRLGDTLIMGDLKTFTRKDTGEVVLEIEQKSEVGTKAKKGAFTMSYKGWSTARRHS